MLRSIIVTLFMLLGLVQAESQVSAPDNAQVSYFSFQPLLFGITLLAPNTAVTGYVTYERPIALNRSLILRPGFVFGTDQVTDTSGSIIMKTRTTTHEFGVALGERFYKERRTDGFYLQPLVQLDYLHENASQGDFSVHSYGFVHKGLGYIGYCSHSRTIPWFIDIGTGYQIRYSSEKDNSANAYSYQIFGLAFDLNVGIGL